MSRHDRIILTLLLIPLMLGIGAGDVYATALILSNHPPTPLAWIICTLVSATCGIIGANIATRKKKSVK